MAVLQNLLDDEAKKSIKAKARFQECYARCQAIHSSGMSLKSVVVGTYFCIDI